MKIFNVRNLFLTILLVSVSGVMNAQAPALIPKPVQLETGYGTLPVGSSLSYSYSKNDALDWMINDFASMLKNGLGIEAKQVSGNDANIRFELLPQNDAQIGKEGYRLNVDEKGILVSANQPAGLFYGIQTLKQLFPAELEGNSGKCSEPVAIPYVKIMDYPRFEWRGMLFDVARHWFTLDQVKEFIDNMARYKFNRLHLHLSDDEGWRIEIKSLPKLTEVGAMRAPRVGLWAEWSKTTPDEPKTYGGYYTHEQIRELVAYGKQRNIEIMPEIDVPGHSSAFVAAYPEISCTPGNYRVGDGSKFVDWGVPGGFRMHYDNTVCPAKEVAYEYLDKIYTEIAELFPFEYIHVGGDEAYHGFWEKSAEVQRLMKRENLKNTDEVQSYFMKRVSAIVTSKGKKMMGWDEILAGGLPSNAAVMSWRGEKGGIEASSLGHPVVMAPSNFAYVDLYQGDPIAEPRTYGMVRLNQSYKFDPQPKGVNPDMILGGQANLWSERLNTTRHAEYMLWPRGWAISESVWSPPEQKNWTDFVQRIEKHFDRYEVMGINYSRSFYDPIFTINKGANGQPLIKMDTEVEDLKIHYTFDESPVDAWFPVYEEPLTIPAGAVNLRVITSRDGKIVGKEIKMPVEEIRKRMR